MANNNVPQSPCRGWYLTDIWNNIERSREKVLCIMNKAKEEFDSLWLKPFFMTQSKFYTYQVTADPLKIKQEQSPHAIKFLKKHLKKFGIGNGTGLHSLMDCAICERMDSEFEEIAVKVPIVYVEDNQAVLWMTLNFEMESAVVVSNISQLCDWNPDDDIVEAVQQTPLKPQTEFIKMKTETPSQAFTKTQLMTTILMETKHRSVLQYSLPSDSPLVLKDASQFLDDFFKEKPQRTTMHSNRKGKTMNVIQGFDDDAKTEYELECNVSYSDNVEFKQNAHVIRNAMAIDIGNKDINVMRDTQISKAVCEVDKDSDIEVTV